MRIQLELPTQWWRTDLAYRHWTVDPQVFFTSRPLSVEEKRERQLDENSFASEVVDIDLAAQLLGHHSLQIGDIVCHVDGVSRDDVADSPDLYIKLRTPAGDSVTLGVIRGDERLDLTLKTQRLNYRK